MGARKGVSARVGARVGVRPRGRGNAYVAVYAPAWRRVNFRGLRRRLAGRLFSGFIRSWAIRTRYAFFVPRFAPVRNNLRASSLEEVSAVLLVQHYVVEVVGELQHAGVRGVGAPEEADEVLVQGVDLPSELRGLAGVSEELLPVDGEVAGVAAVPAGVLVAGLGAPLLLRRVGWALGGAEDVDELLFEVPGCVFHVEPPCVMMLHGRG